jgi:hypothetical protein
MPPPGSRPSGRVACSEYPPFSVVSINARRCGTMRATFMMSASTRRVMTMRNRGGTPAATPPSVSPSEHLRCDDVLRPRSDQRRAPGSAALSLVSSQASGVKKAECGVMIRRPLIAAMAPGLGCQLISNPSSFSVVGVGALAKAVQLRSVRSRSIRRFCLRCPSSRCSCSALRCLRCSWVGCSRGTTRAGNPPPASRRLVPAQPGEDSRAVGRVQ